MKTINCHGHEKPITKIKYNLEGDLLFSIAKDTIPCVWYSINGEKLGTYNGHTGAIYGLDVKWDTTKIITGSADTNCILWDAETGKNIGARNFDTTVRCVAFNMDGSQILITTQQHRDEFSKIFIFDANEFGNIDVNCIKMIDNESNSPILGAIWGPLDEFVITTHKDGTINQWDAKTGELMNSVQEHKMDINDIQPSPDMAYFITASSDLTAKLFDMDTLKCLKNYKASRQVNSASISPLYDHVALGGGEDVRQVTRSGDKGGFETKFYHLIYEEEFARVPGHFGPINSLAFHPDGKSFSTGGEEAIIKINYFDSSYFSYKLL